MESDPARATEEVRDPSTSPPSEEPQLYCPVCSQRLTPIKCKLLCERCGYYMSCADYY